MLFTYVCASRSSCLLSTVPSPVSPRNASPAIAAHRHAGAEGRTGTGTLRAANMRSGSRRSVTPCTDSRRGRYLPGTANTTRRCMADVWCAIRGGRERLGSSAAQETDMGRYSLPKARAHTETSGYHNSARRATEGSADGSQCLLYKIDEPHLPSNTPKGVLYSGIQCYPNVRPWPRHLIP